MSFTLAKYYLGDQIKEDEMGGACGMYGEEEKCVQAQIVILRKCIQSFGWKT